jgi:hypothetical protein
MEELRLDGNAAGGLLGEVFAFEMTSARISCAGCGATGALGDQMLYATSIGTVLRCATCDNPLIRVAREVDERGRLWLDLKGSNYIQIENTA